MASKCHFCNKMNHDSWELVDSGAEPGKMHSRPGTSCNTEK